MRLNVNSPVLRNISNYKLKFLKLQEIYQIDLLEELIEYLDENKFDYSIKRVCDSMEIETRNFEEGLRINQNISEDDLNEYIEITDAPTLVNNTEDVKIVSSVIPNIEDYIDDDSDYDDLETFDDDIRHMSVTKPALARYDEIVNYIKYADYDYFDEDREIVDKYRNGSKPSKRYESLKKYLDMD